MNKGLIKILLIIFTTLVLTTCKPSPIEEGEGTTGQDDGYIMLVFNEKKGANRDTSPDTDTESALSHLDVMMYKYNEDNYIYYSPILNKQARDVDMIPFDNQVFKTTKRVETLTIENIVDENGLMYFTDYLLRGKIENNQILIKIQTSTGTEFVEPNSSLVANNDIISHSTD